MQPDIQYFMCKITQSMQKLFYLDENSVEFFCESMWMGFFASFLEMSRLSHINCLILVCMYKFYEGFDNLIFLSMNNDVQSNCFMYQI